MPCRWSCGSRRWPTGLKDPSGVRRWSSCLDDHLETRVRLDELRRPSMGPDTSLLSRLELDECEVQRIELVESSASPPAPTRVTDDLPPLGEAGVLKEFTGSSAAVCGSRPKFSRPSTPSQRGQDVEDPQSLQPSIGVADGTAVDVVLDAIPYGAVIEIVDPPGAALAAARLRRSERARTLPAPRRRPRPRAGACPPPGPRCGAGAARPAHGPPAPARARPGACRTASSYGPGAVPRRRPQALSAGR